eukprot:TRINITY_DN8408_c0_g1::TRINITY_DN8408_c0_g1_i1::g.29170::m.29170 TRINITY_DN8408_c0_g1::TRINITY_DN8408_c0_g1_i1::g.29170  ORF type:complete len:664 (-),score=135.62,sp/P48726/PP2A1_PARTE/35.74/3e-45,Metallophos/PF00149.23/6.4e-30,WD40_alt/PF14077.1/0.15,WD40_alt/PF14077.1/5.1e+03,DUF605/PF04652.11/6,Pol_alpha_B_N/PF08418.5/6.2e+03,Pol_alpha_B_N/PF08418.5/0.99,MAP65_ASE1/PF03999.7/10 TRINITY_DN8408_c0_g1_i1:341-2332(-)
MMDCDTSYPMDIDEKESDKIENDKDSVITLLKSRVEELEEELRKMKRPSDSSVRYDVDVEDHKVKPPGMTNSRSKKDIEYQLSSVWIQMDRSGVKQDVVSVEEILQHQPPGAGRQGRFNRAVSVDSGSIILRQRSSSIAVDRTSRPTRLLEALSYFENATQDKPPLDWKDVDMNILGNFLLALCDDIRKILESEPRVLHVEPPTYILGDIHGNYHDLSYFSSALWGLGIQASPASFLFLGDYVDRGPHSIEVVAHLFSLKLLAPTKVFLLRGNHELRVVNGDVFAYGAVSFRKQCMQQFGEPLGNRVWEAVNTVFDCLPLAAIVDGKLFCVHGGIPAFPTGATPCDRLKMMTTLPACIPDLSTHQLAEDVLWSDPADSTEEPSLDQYGFGFNTHRGGGKFFGNQALDTFLREYGFSHLIRAHEVSKVGIQVTKHARVITIFSSSRYCGMDNQAACILVHHGKIRVIILDTEDRFQQFQQIQQSQAQGQNAQNQPATQAQNATQSTAPTSAASNMNRAQSGATPYTPSTPSQSSSPASSPLASSAPIVTVTGASSATPNASNNSPSPTSTSPLSVTTPQKTAGTGPVSGSTNANSTNVSGVNSGRPPVPVTSEAALQHAYCVVCQADCSLVPNRIRDSEGRYYHPSCWDQVQTGGLGSLDPLDQ